MRTRSNLPAGVFADLSDEADTDRGQYIAALARGLDVLRAFTPGAGPLGNLDIAVATGLPRPTVSRITYTLSMLGYLEFLPKLSRYQLGPSVLSLGYSFLSSLLIRRAAHAHMVRLADEVDGAVALGIRDRLSIVYADLARGPGVLTLRLTVGARLPMHKSATGLAFLAGLPGSERQFIEAAIARRMPDEWPVLRDQIEKAAFEVSAHGFYVGLGTFERGINSVASTFCTPDEQGYFVFNVTGPANEFPARRMYEDVGPRLVGMLTSVREDWCAMAEDEAQPRLT